MKPEEIFRFVNVRPVQLAPEENVITRFASAGEKTELETKIADLEGDNARENAIDLARRVLAAEPPDTQAIDRVIYLSRIGTEADTAAEARHGVETELAGSLEAFLTEAGNREFKSNLWNRLHAHVLLPEEQPVERERIYSAIRAVHYLELLVRRADEDEANLTWKELSAVTPIIPRSLIPRSPVMDNREKDRMIELIEERLDSVRNEVRALDTARTELENADRVETMKNLRTVVERPGFEKPVSRPLRSEHLDEARFEVIEAAAAEPQRGREGAVVRLPVERTTITVPKRTPWLFDENAQGRLSASTREVLDARRSKFAELEVAEVVSALEGETHMRVSRILESVPAELKPLVNESATLKAILAAVPIAGYTMPPSVAFMNAPAPGSAAARGIQPLGIGDLLVVKQTLQRYTAGEVAHIENVLKSEFKTRMHSRVAETEEIVITETEQLEETEKDLQTTERFELQKESQKTIEEKMSLDAGVAITATYGPVSLTAHADFALSQSTSESNKTASTFAKQVTERSVSRVMQRVRQERMRRTLERLEEKNEHGFDNKLGLGHVIGIYRWVDKYYKARLINYGRRLMIELIIPEPAAFYLHVQSSLTTKGVTVKKPTEPLASGRPLEPGDLTKWNYSDFVAQYDVEDVEAYPPEVIRISAAYAEAAGASENAHFGKTSEKLNVPKGYKCNDVFGEMNREGYPGYFLDVLIGGQRWGSVTAANVQGIVPISVMGWAAAFHVNVVAICGLTPEAKAEWQLKTYTAIMNAYQRQLADYEEQVAAAQIQGGVTIQGRNPDLNRKIEKDEIRKGALRMLTNNFAATRVSGTWRFNEMFDGMRANQQFGYPEFDVAESLVEGKIIQFFEQAFEWNNVTYRFYPYSWGRKSGWKDTFPLTDNDPLFTDFLRAGAARVVVPVHPAYNETVLHYLSTNEIWNGGEPPTLDDPLYISIVDELKSDSDADLDSDLPSCAPDSDFPCLADEWEVKLPTTLVYLQEDSVLPDYTVPDP